MTKENLILRLSNELGNQLFMYAAGYSFAKKLNRNFYIDNETAFRLKKNISSYALDEFNIKGLIAPKSLKFLHINGYLKRKFLLKIDKIKKKKKFYVEHKNKEKITFFDDKFLENKFSENLFLEGHFESEKYFYDYRKNLKNIFKVKESLINNKNKYIDDLTQNNSVSICIRQNRYSEGKLKNDHKSSKFTKDTIEYVDRAVKYVKQKVNNPKFFIWSNDFNNLNEYFNKNEFTFIDNQENKALNDFHLFSYSKHFIVGPTSFHWWGAWLNDNPNKICIRPSNINPSNNKDFWPNSWVNI